MNEDERRIAQEQAVAAGKKHLPRLTWTPYRYLPGAEGEFRRDNVHVHVEQGFDGQWESHVLFANQEVYVFAEKANADTAASMAQFGLAHMRDTLISVLRPLPAGKPRKGTNT